MIELEGIDNIVIYRYKPKREIIHIPEHKFNEIGMHHYGNRIYIKFEKDNKKRSISISPDEGKVRYNVLWLSERDDEKAEKLYKEYVDNLKNHYEIIVKRLEEL